MPIWALTALKGLWNLMGSKWFWLAVAIGGLYAYTAHRENAAYIRGKQEIQARWDKDRQEWNAYVIHEREKWDEQAARDADGWAKTIAEDRASIARLRNMGTGRTCLDADAIIVLNDLRRSSESPAPSERVSGEAERIATDKDVAETIGTYESMYKDVYRRLNRLIDWVEKELPSKGP